MNRRHFIHAATASVVLPTGIASSIAAVATEPARRNYVFFDDRFDRARPLTAAWAGSGKPIAVQGDITALWSNGLERMIRAHRIDLRGVTADSFLFCLKVLVGEHASFDLQVSKFDRNLLIWTMRTIPKLSTERSDA